MEADNKTQLVGIENEEAVEENNKTLLVGNENEEALEENNKTQLVGNENGGNGVLKEVNLGRKCDLYNGSWVKDEGHPLYQMGSCPYIDDAFTCHDNGRPDSDYTKWRWKPHDCDIPRYSTFMVSSNLSLSKSSYFFFHELVEFSFEIMRQL